MDDTLKIAYKAIIIAGYYGFGNTGDEAILSAIIQKLRADLENPQICVLSGNPEVVKQIHGTDSIHWEDIKGILEKMTICDVVIIGGGGIFHDYWGVDASSVFTSRHSGISFYMTICLMAELLNKPIVLYSVGIGPLFTDAGKEFTKNILKKSSLVFVRDQRSRQEAINLGLHKANIHLSVDPVFGLEDFGESGNNDLQQNQQRIITNMDDLPRPLLGISVRNWDINFEQEYWEIEIANAIDLFHDLYGGTTIFLPFQNSQEILLDDGKVSACIQAKLRSKKASIISDIVSIKDTYSIISCCDLVLGMRLHSIIFALKKSIPLVGIMYDPKLLSIFEHQNLRKFGIDLKSLNAEKLFALLVNAYKNKPTIEKSLKQISEKKKSVADKDSDFIAGWINKQHTDPDTFTDNGEDILKATTLSLISSISDKENKILFLEARIQEEERKYRLVENSLTEQNKNISENLSKVMEKLGITNIKIRELSKKVFVLEKDLINAEKIKRSLEQDLKSLNSSLGNKDQQLKKSAKSLSSSYKEIDDLKKASKFMERELFSIKESHGWKILWLFWKIRLVFIPRDSQLDRILKNNHNKDVPGQKLTITQLINKKLYLLLSKYEYAFFLYKRERKKAYQIDLNKIKTQFIPGLVSIILPVYNGEKYLAESLDSILNQTYNNFELIVINDGSTDSTSQILNIYENKDARVKIFHQSNKKLPLALNTGFQKANGEYWTWTSHDNRFHADFLEKMVHYLKKNPKIDLCYANMDIFDSDGEPLLGSTWYAGYQRPYGSQHIALPRKTLELNTWPNNYLGGAFLYRGTAGWLIGEYSKYQFTREDYDYWMLVNSLLNIQHVNFDKSVYDYRFHKDSLTEKDDSLNITGDRKYLMMFDDFRRDFFLSPVIWYIEHGRLSNSDMEIIYALKKYISGKGHIVMNDQGNQHENIPAYWVPRIYLKVISDHDKRVDIPLHQPASALKVVLSLSKSDKMDNLGSGWDHKIRFLPTRGSFYNDLYNKCVCINDYNTIFTVLDIRSKVKHTHYLEELIDKDQNKKLPVSVIVCTINRSQSLICCIKTLACQSLDGKEFEIIIVNNGPMIEDSRSINQFLDENDIHFSGIVKSVNCPLPGLSHARNAGLSEARGEILVFLDDDSLAASDLLESYLNAYSLHKNVGVIGGHIYVNKPGDLDFKYWNPGWERFWSQFVTGYQDYTEVHNWWEYPWGANWSARKEALLKIGGFRIHYGRKGNDFSGGEELVAANLVKQLGYTIAVLPQAKVIHNVILDRFNLTHVRRTIRSGILTHYEAQLRLHAEQDTTVRNSFIGIKNNLVGLLKSLLDHKTNKKGLILEKRYYLEAYWELFIRQVLVYFDRLFSRNTRF